MKRKRTKTAVLAREHAALLVESMIAAAQSASNERREYAREFLAALEICIQDYWSEL